MMDRRAWTRAGGAVVCSLAAVAPAWGQPVFPSNFHVDIVAAGLGATGDCLVVAPTGFGTFGGQLFMVNGDPTDTVVRINPATGDSVLFASVPSQAASLTFGPGGAFGSDLFVNTNMDPMVANSGRILRVTSTGVVTQFGTPSVPASGLVVGAVGIAFSLAGPFGTFLYTGNSGGAADAITRLPAAGAPTASFHSFGFLDGRPTGIAFGSGANGWTNNLYVGIARGPGAGAVVSGVYVIDSASARTALATGAAFSGVFDIRFGPGGAFGTDLYVSDRNGSILRVTPAGAISTFISGLSPGLATDRARTVAFDGSRAMYVYEPGSGRIYRLRCKADINADGGVSVQDLFDFLALWFGGCP